MRSTTPRTSGEDSPPAVSDGARAAIGDDGNNNNGNGSNVNTLDGETRALLDHLSKLTLDDDSDQCFPVMVESLGGVRIVMASAGHHHR